MTREEASEVITIIRGEVHPAVQKEWEQMAADVCIEALDLAIAALKGPAREQVEKMRGEWIDFDGEKVPVDKYGQPFGWAQCSACREYLTASDEYPCIGHFCPNCGTPMTDEAVDMVMEKINNMEEMTNEH